MLIRFAFLIVLGVDFILKKNKVKIFLKSSYFLMIYLFSLKIRRLKNKKVDFFEVDFEKTQSTPNTNF